MTGTLAGLLISLTLLAASCNAAEVTQTTSDLELTKLMGPPFYSGEVLPTPRQARYDDEYLTLVDGAQGLLTAELRVEYTGPSAALAQRLWDQRIASYQQQFAVEEWTPAEGCLPILVTLRENPDVTPQGYELTIGPDAITCAGADNQGVMNAVASLLALVHVRDGKLVARCAHIVDKPTFVRRYTSEYWVLADSVFDWMMLNKVNGYSSGYANLIDWRGEMAEANVASLKRAGDYIRRYRTMDFLPQIHIGPRRKDRPALDQGDPADIAKLLQTVEDVMTWTDADEIMILFDDVLPVLTMPREMEKFDSLGEATGQVLGELYEHMQQFRPGSRLLFCPPCYQGLKHRKWREDSQYRPQYLEYMSDMQSWNPNIVSVWTGPVTESRFITDEDIAAYRELLGPDRPLFYWDNTWHYHQPLRNFHAKYPEGFVDECASASSYININLRGVIGRYFTVTANDYYWNPEGFDVERSWRQAATHFMGADALPVVERFYALRGDGYNYYFTRGVDLEKLKVVFEDLERTSLTPEIPEACWAAYESIRRIQTEAE